VLALAAAALSHLPGSTAMAQSDDHWNNNLGGTWDVDSNWDLGIAPTTTDYNAIIDLPGIYEVDIVNDFSVAAITLNSANATVVQSQGTVDTPVLNLNAGTYNLFGGSLTGTSVYQSGGTLNLGDGILNNVTIASGDLSIAPSHLGYIQGTLAVTDGNIDMGDNSTLYFDGSGQSIDSASISSSGISSNGYSIYVTGPDSGGTRTLTLAPSVAVYGGAQFDCYGQGTLNNLGTIDADSAGISINTSNFTNAGTITADDGNYVVINATTWSNTGILQATNASTLYLGGSFVTGDLGTVRADSTSTIDISGSVDNTNATLKPTAGGQWTLDGSITNGTLDVSNGNFSVTGGTLNNLHVIGGDLVVLPGDPCMIQGTLAIDNHNLDAGLNTSITFDGIGQSFDNLNISSGGKVYGISISGPDSDDGSGDPVALTLGAGVTIHGGATITDYLGGGTLNSYGTINADSAPIVIDVANINNYGTLQATAGHALAVNATNLANFGTLSATGGSTLTLGGNLNLAAMGNLIVDARSTANFAGTLNNANNTFTANVAGSVILSGTLNGGTLNASDNFTVDGGTLDGVAIGRDGFSVSHSVDILDGLFTSANSYISMAAASTIYFDKNTDTLDNLDISSGGRPYQIYIGGPNSSAADSVTLGSGVTIHGGATLYSYGLNDLANDGTIDADSGSISISTFYFNNSGGAVLEATRGNTVYITTPDWENGGLFSATGGSTINLGGHFTTAELGSFTTDATSQIVLSGSMDNELTTFSPTGNFLVKGGTLSNGTIDLSQGSFSVASGTLSNVSLIGGNLQVAASAQLYIQNGLTLGNGSMELANGASVYFNGSSQSIDNVNFSGTSASAYQIYVGDNNSPQTLTLGSGVTVHGGARIENFGGTPYAGATQSLVNNGTILGDTDQIDIDTSNFNNNGTVNGSGAYVYVLSPTFVNAGLAEATSGGNLTINSATFTNSGTLSAQAGSTITINSSNFIENGKIAANGGAVQINGGVTVANNTVSLVDGNLQTQSGANFWVTGASTLSESGYSSATIGGQFALAIASPDRVTYTLSSGALNCQQSAIVGENGAGTFFQSGGSTIIAGVLGVGNAGILTSGTGTGAVNVSGGTLSVQTLLLGSTAGGSGDMTVSGTANVTIGGGAHLNDLNVSGGTVTVLNQAAPQGEDPELAQALVGGYLTNGALNVSGTGSVNSPNLKLGITSGMTGTMTQTGGAASFSTLSAGCDGTITAGRGNGVVNVSAGTLYADTVLLGSTGGGSGDMTVSGSGSVTIGGGAHLNDLSVSGGTVTVLNQAAPEGEDPELAQALVGGYLTNGALNVSKTGSVNSPWIKMGITSGKTGTFNQTGGSVNVTTLSIGADISSSTGAGIGIANLSGGSVTIGNLLIGSSAGGVGTVNLSSTADVAVNNSIALTSGALNLDTVSLSIPSGNSTIGGASEASSLHLHNGIITGNTNTTLSLGTNSTLDAGGDPADGEQVGSVSLINASLALTASTSTLHLAVGGSPSDPGSDFDQIVLSQGGMFTATNSTIQILPLPGVTLNQPYAVVVADAGASIGTAIFANFAIDPSYGGQPLAYNVTLDGSQLDVTFTAAAPEPGAAIALPMLTGVLLTRRRKAAPQP
jgi:hypothetical protein